MRFNGKKFFDLCIEHISADSPADAAACKVVARLNRKSAVCSVYGCIGNRKAQELTDACSVAQQSADVC